MADATKNLTDTANNATGGRDGGPGETIGKLGNTATGAVAPKKKPKKKGGNNNEEEDEETTEGFGLDNGSDVKGSLKVHIKLDLEADIKVYARIRGDIAIGIL
ncbi:hypothetical protein BKA58DRAFT_440037 [Alternaria rosae]|uniref:uncharacterized protein n=1 Tax=Alternaria rosae TaxID=1187941 RepID=UPI001E8E4F58|nr:uncharacterized protein BKA58DRAFT_440037 [Alternaria rosae]KAH6870490.1 hypothetical protein BKA58DRAFT_440037 [Alternaria rosae]